MIGKILAYDPLKAEGIISAEDGNRYAFGGSDWRSSGDSPRTGAQVDFTVDGNLAREIFAMSSGNALADAFGGGQKSPIVAGLLALFLGAFGVHKFYLGYNTQGIILLVTSVIGWSLAIIVIGLIPLMVVGVVCFIEAIIYLTKSESEFNRIYVDGKKYWF